MASLSYIPEAHEQPYYEELFLAADTSRMGSINGSEAVQFFSRSKLTVDTLKNIWTVSDQNPTTGSLDRKKFAVAVRLIQLAQNGHKAQGANLGAPPEVTLKPVFFDGVTGVTVQFPPAAAAAAPPPPAPAAAPVTAAPPLQPLAPAMMTPPPSVAFQQPAAPGYAPPPRELPVQQPPSNPGIPPPTPPRPSAAPPVMSMALTTQDPYGMSPQEQSRYEDLFPTYETKKDGYVYGKEAVELFGKSGLSQDQLRGIWNMVDQPVDNRLDKIEFAIAMHLIVCVSKKNQPLPSSLPISLKQLKSHRRAVAAENAAFQEVPTMDSGEIGDIGGGASVAAGSLAAGSMVSSLQGPPPLESGGGMSISDAFEGLSTTESYVSSLPSTGGPPPLPTGGFSHPSAIPEPSMKEPALSSPGLTPSMPDSFPSIPEPPTVETIEEPAKPSYAPEPTPAMSVSPPAPKSSTQLAQSYQMADDHTELAKLKETLQKLQAENISLKAQLGSVTEEEKDVAKETAATVEEINKLSSELSALRTDVLAAKTKLLESSAELAAAKEKQGVLNDLISETVATKDALEAANKGIGDANETIHAPEQKRAAANAAASGFETDLFGFGAPISAPVSVPPVTPAQPPVITDRMSRPAPKETTSLGVDTFASETPAIPLEESNPAAPAPTPALAPAPIVTGVGGDAFFGIPDPEPNLHGGSAFPVVTTGTIPPSTSALPSNASSAGGSAVNMDELENLRKQALEAQQAAREAEDTRRTLAIETDRLRQLANDAEAGAQALQEKAATKKRGFGRGKKNMQKDAAKALEEVAEKKKHFREMEMQASNAQTLAMETKREADKLRQQVEQAELDLAAAESAREAEQAGAPLPMTHEAPAPTSAPTDKPSDFYNGGGLIAPSLGATFGNGAPPSGNFEGFGGIMGGTGSSGASIPTPQGDPYSNPFQ